MTDAAAETFAKLPKDKQQEVLKALFDPEAGIGYTLARTNIHSCDFSACGTSGETTALGTAHAAGLTSVFGAMLKRRASTGK